ncbi:MAG: hypothetical protein GXY54_03095 [Deltaproteobacteria bacterium]|nr:hypothetical protein [Deltaproteobacteria bacterium]
MKKPGRYLLGGTLALLLALALAAGVFLVWVQTDRGAKFVEETLNRHAVWDGGKLSVAGVAGRFPFDVFIDEIRILDDLGAWLIIEKARLAWSWEALLKGNLDIREVSAEAILLSRLPQAAKEDQKERKDSAGGKPWSLSLPAIIIEKLFCPRIWLGGAVAGEEAVFSLNGSLHAPRSGFTGTVMDLQRLDKAETRFHLHAFLTGKEKRFDLDVTFHDSATLAALLDSPAMPRSLTVKLGGSGPLDSWTGRLDVDGQEHFQAGIDLRFTHGNTSRLTGEGEINLGSALIPQPYARYVAHPLALTIRLASAPENLFRLEELRLVSPSFDLEGEADFHADGNRVDGHLEMELRDLQPLIGQAGLSSSAPLRAEIHCDGPLNALKGTARVDWGEVAGHGFSLAASSLVVQGGMEPYPGEQTGFVSGRLALAGLRHDGRPGLPAEYLLDFGLAFHDGIRLVIDRFDLSAQGVESRLRGDIDLDRLVFSSNLVFSLKEVKRFLASPTSETAVAGDLLLEATAAGNLRERRMTLESQASLADFSAANELADLLAGSRPTAGLKLALEPDGVLRIREASVTTPEIKVTATGSIALEEKVVDFQSRMEMADLTRLGKALGRDLGGDFHLSALLRGQLDRPEVAMKAAVNRLQIDDLDPFDIRAGLVSSPRGEHLVGKGEVKITQGDRVMDIGADFFLGKERLQLKKISARGLDVKVAGELAMDTKTLLTKGGLRLKVENLGEIGRVLQSELGGMVEAGLDFVPSRGKQDFLFTLQAGKIDSQGVSLSQGKLAAKIEDLFAERRLRADLSLSGLAAADVRLDSLQAEASGRDNDLTFQARLAGYVQENLKLSVAGRYLRDEESQTVRVNSFQGIYAQEDFRLRSPFSVVLSPSATALTPVEMSFGPGLLKLEGRLDAEKVDARVELDKLSLADLPLGGMPPLQGSLLLLLQVRGDPQAPLVEGDFRVAGLALAAPSLRKTVPLDIHAALRMAEGLVTVDGRLREGETPLADIRFELPVGFSLAPFGIQLPEPLPLKGVLRADLMVERLTTMILPDGQIVSGHLSTQMNIGGSHIRPSLDGHLQVDGAAYQNLDVGIFLSDIRLLMKAQGQRIDIPEFAATDGKEGRLRGQGFVELDLERNFPWAFDLRIDAADVLHHKLAQVQIAAGEIALKGDGDAASAKGAVTFGNIEVNLPGQSPPEVADLDVTEINKEGGAGTGRERTPAAAPYPLELDLDLRLPARVFVRGHGLDSEWSGNLKVTGFAHRPSIRGNLDLVRGRLTFLDRRFNLLDSSIFFDGSYPPDPIVDINAGYRQKGKSVTVGIAGPAADPELRLSSDPPMHDDEILAWILFGRDLSSLTPFQAITLANAVRALAMGDTGPGFMDRVRSMVGVDDIDISQDPEEGNTQFGVGKYIHEKVYLQVKKGLAPGSDSISVEVELTPKVRLESNVDSGKGGGMGIFWKHDY